MSDYSRAMTTRSMTAAEEARKTAAEEARKARETADRQAREDEELWAASIVGPYDPNKKSECEGPGCVISGGRRRRMSRRMGRSRKMRRSRRMRRSRSSHRR